MFGCGERTGVIAGLERSSRAMTVHAVRVREVSVRLAHVVKNFTK
jgi:hypothetical protein